MTTISTTITQDMCQYESSCILSRLSNYCWFEELSHLCGVYRRKQETEKEIQEQTEMNIRDERIEGLVRMLKLGGSLK